MVRYRLFEEVRTVEDIEYIAYGVAAFDESGEIICVAPDITVVKEKAFELAEMCETARLSPVHLPDIAIDYIISESY